jgi:tetraacyldisaccharide 4'-kinase
VSSTPHGLLATALAPASWAYGAAVALRNRKFDRGLGVVRLSVPVISVGNISVGGTGKSPVVRWIASLLLAEGVKPLISMRGYGAKPGEKSDEAIEHEELLPGMDVLAQPDRVAALQPFLVQHPEVGCVILDDGFQHRRIARDLDIVLIDAQRPGLDGWLLPAGRLREPAANLRRADAVIVTRADRIDEALSRQIELLSGKPPVAWLRHAWTRFRVFSRTSNESSFEAMSWLRGKKVIVAAGIGNQNAFVRQIISASAKVESLLTVKDHQNYTKRMVAKLAGDMQFDALVTTLKDWVKIRRVIDLSQWRAPIVVPELAIEAIEGETRVVELLRGVISRP